MVVVPVFVFLPYGSAWKVLNLKKKSDVQVGLVNTFHILQTSSFKLQTLYEKTLKIFKFLNFEYVVLFLDPKLLNKSATRFILRWNLLNKAFISPFWVWICMGGTLNTQNSKILSTPLSLNNKIVEYKCGQIYSMVTFVEQNLIK
jgi:hypothetical protein